MVLAIRKKNGKAVMQIQCGKCSGGGTQRRSYPEEIPRGSGELREGTQEGLLDWVGHH